MKSHLNYQVGSPGSLHKRCLAATALLLVGHLLTSCTLFLSEDERNMREYRRYVEQSMREREKRRAIIIEEKRAADQQVYDEAAIRGDQARSTTTMTLEPSAPQTPQVIYPAPGAQAVTD